MEEKQQGVNSAVKYWLNEITAAQKREKDFRKDGQRVIQIYEGKKHDEIPYNILYSNTETLLPALYSAVPRPVVQRRFKDEDAIGKAAAQAGQRVLEFMLDTNIEGYETFDEGVRSAVLDGLLPGRGITCIKYDAEIGELPTESIDDEQPDETESTPYKKSELVCVDARSWNRVYFGYAKKWSKVPWIAYEEYIDEDEAERLFGREISGKLVYTDSEQEAKENEESDYDDRNEGERKTCLVYQIWDKNSKKIKYITPQYEDYLKVGEDPLQLTGFFNCPKPLTFLEKSNDLLPVSLYLLYENQAKELNEITRRITRVVRAIKAKAIYDAELGEDIKNLVEADDNELVPADKSSSLAAEKGLQNAIWAWPIEQLVGVLNQLILAREQCKRVIYEVTGISDIIRGSSVASETATAQNLKSQWGTLRLKRLQKEVQRYARDMLRIMLEIASTKFSEETWVRMTGLPYLTDAKVAELTNISKVLQIQGTPEAQQQLQQIQQQLQTPQWSQVIKVLRDDLQRAYKIDIETNSTVEPEAAEDQKNIADLLNALGQYLNGVGPLVAKGMLPFGVAQNMMLAISRRFRFGSEIEDDIKQMQPPPPENNAEQQKAEQAKNQQEIQMKQIEMKQAENDAQYTQSENQLKLQIEQQKANLEMERLQLEQQSMREEHMFKMQEMKAKAQLTEIVTQSKLRIAEATASAKEKQNASV